MLAQHGLGEALRVAGRIAPIPTTVEADAIGRRRPEVEATVYFACMEALQNAAKHARGATGVAISLTDNGSLRFEVRDDGEGFVVPTVVNGNGLTNLRDRVAAVGGSVEVRSVPGRGHHRRRLRPGGLIDGTAVQAPASTAIPRRPRTTARRTTTGASSTTWARLSRSSAPTMARSSTRTTAGT